MKVPLRVWVATLLMVLASAAAFLMKPTQLLKDPQLNLNTLIPQKFGDWIVDPNIIPIKPTPDVQANLDTIYDQIVARTYVNTKGERMMLSVAYGGDQSDALKAHRQEVCYTAQGFTIRALSHGSLNYSGVDIPVTRMHAVMRQRSEPVTYWFTMGDNVVLGRVERMLVQVGYGLRGKIPDGMLVRVSSLDGNAKSAWVDHQAFIAAMAAGMGPDSGRLVGHRR
jgi:EpsI family protein